MRFWSIRQAHLDLSTITSACCLFLWALVGWCLEKVAAKAHHAETSLRIITVVDYNLVC
jgi:hypothetical protein